MKYSERPIKLGMHTYTLHLSGLGESWGFAGAYAFEKYIDLMQLMDLSVEWGLDGLHVTNVDLESLAPSRLMEVKAAAEAHDLYLEYNVSFNAPSDPRVNSTVRDALLNGKAIGAELVKFSLDIERPHPVYGSCMHPVVMRQLAARYDEFKANLSLMDELGLQIAIENHCDTYADEVIWLIKQLNHPKVGACLDTINSFVVMEGPEACVEKMAPYATCCHFCDNKIVVDPDGTHSIGVAIGQGDIDCVRVMNLLREKAPLDRITFEVEYEIGRDSLEVAREKEIQACKDSIAYLRNVLKLGVRGR
ncbi:sugar phosphate isomerase/epimerase family protein [Synergistes jonesii]|uniref:Sugar isomerase n=1 Tax=Synergistes jonesii TaxID=2754 RepID=A0A073IUE5_9BACT|nr:TIM barrel protein [Synergistes jonesii]KEJ93066.1 sugar isomerase [Synergistes jonesii]OFB60807.1 sugar isomerase [Synergistes jonesii]OFB64696.1 sugar isomerase [Synergistes jonesii]OFB65997.1 sugar isomerase [Synergistes jonesii]OFB68856.1 sugar isomerase [Synergistes jonesii]